MIAVRHDSDEILFAVPIPGASHLHYMTMRHDLGNGFVL